MQFLTAVLMLAAAAVAPAKAVSGPTVAPLTLTIVWEKQVVVPRKPLDEMVTELRVSGFPVVHQDIDDEDFPEPGTDLGPRTLVLVSLNRSAGTDEIIAAMKAQRLRPATVRQLVVHAHSWDVDHDGHVAALGSFLRLEHGTEVGGADRYAPYLGEYAARPMLNLRWTSSGWDQDWYFLAERR